MLGFTAVEFFIVSVFIFAVLYWLFPRKLSIIPMLILTFLLALLAYKAVPNVSDDLSRYFMQLDYLREYGMDYLQKCFREKINNWDVYRVTGYYFYYMSKFKSNKMLPAVTVFIVYTLMFTVIYRIAMRLRINKVYLFGACMFFISTYWYYELYSGIRNALTFAIIFACGYFHIVEKRFIPLCFVGYGLACFMHSTGTMFVAVVLIAWVSMYINSKSFNYLLILGLAGGNVLIQFLARFTHNKLILSLAGQAEENTSEMGFNIGTKFLVNISVLLVVGLMIYYFSYYINQNHYIGSKRFAMQTRLYKYFMVIVYFMLGSIVSSMVFHRLARWVLPVIGAIIFMIGMQSQRNEINDKGEHYLSYEAPRKQMRRMRIRSTVIIGFIAYTAVHFWYLCTGSSLVWMHS